MTNAQHRTTNTMLSIVLFIVLVLSIFSIENKIEHNMEQCEIMLYEKLTGQKDPIQDN